MERVATGKSKPRDRAASLAFQALSAAESKRPDAAFRKERRETVLASMDGQAKTRASRAKTIVVKPKLSRSAIIRRVALVPALILTLFVVFTAGAYAMSLGKNPDSSLYGTKLFFENVRLSLTGSDEAKAELELEYTQKRVEEMRHLAAREIGRGAERCASNYRERLNDALARINRLSGGAFDRLSAEFLNITGEQLASLEGLATEASESLAPAVERARQTCNGARQQMMGAQQMRMGPGGSDSSGVPGGSMKPGGGSQGGSGGSGDSGGGMMPDGGQNGGSGNSGGSMMSPDSSGGGMYGSDGISGGGGTYGPDSMNGGGMYGNSGMP